VVKGIPDLFPSSTVHFPDAVRDIGYFSRSGVHLIQHYPISFLVVSGLGTALFLWGNLPKSGLGSAVWPSDLPVTRTDKKNGGGRKTGP